MKKCRFVLLLSLGLACSAHGQEPFSYSIEMESKSGGTNYVSATIGNTVTTSFLLDTGSGMLVVNQKTFSQLKKANAVTYSHDAAARLANGKLQKVKMYSISTLRIGDNCEINDLEVAVMKKGNNILGMSALSKAAPFAVSVNPPTLMLSQCSQALTASINQSQ